VLTGTELASGDKVIDARLEAAAVTLRLLLDCSEPNLAVMVTVPDMAPVAMPEELMLATLESEDVHCAELVTSFELPSE